MKRKEKTHRMIIWLIGLLYILFARYYRYQLLSLFYFILLLKGLSAAPGKNQYPTQDFDGKDDYHHKYIFVRDKSR